MSRTRTQPTTDQGQNLTHEDLRKAAICWLKLRKYDYRNHVPIGGNCTILTSEIVSNASDNPDAIGWDMGHSVLVECKASRADFHKDQKKPQRQVGTGMGEHRYYFTPKGLLSPEELPEGWGLVEYENGKASITVHAPYREIDLKGHLDEKLILLSLVRRIRTREFLIIQPEQMEEILTT